jgi:hypothetical protein
MRSIAHYELHQASAAISDLDRLYAINPAYPDLGTVRDAMKSGTFSVASIHFRVQSG